MRRLTGGLQFMRAWQQEWVVPTTGAISQARDRLGEAPLKMLFERLAVPLAVTGTPGAWLGARRVMAIDGVKLDVPDTRANVEGFGRPRAGCYGACHSPKSRSSAWENAVPMPWWLRKQAQ